MVTKALFGVNSVVEISIVTNIPCNDIFVHENILVAVSLID